MKHPFSFSLLSALFIILWGSNIVAQCPDQLTNQSTSINLSPGYPRSGTAATGVQIGASCGLHIVGDLGASGARYEIPINLADNALISGDQIEISMNITNVTANFRYDLRNGSTVLDASTEPVSGRIITIPSGATTLIIRLFPNNGQSDVSGSFDISNLSVSKVGSGSNDTQAPTAPTVTGTSQIPTEVDLSWSVASDNIGVTNYLVYQGSSLKATLNNSSTTYTITGLIASNTYQFSVIAMDAAGNKSTGGNAITVTTAADTVTGALWSEQGSSLFYNGGSVGIGTENPEYRLHVSNGVKLGKTTIGVTPANSGTSWIRDEWLTGNYGPPKWDNSLNKWVRPAGNYNDIGGIVFQDEGTYFLRRAAGSQTEFTNAEFLNSAYLFAHMFTGNVGIGTTTPDSKLTVKGNIHAEEVKVDLSVPGPDYVFKDDYDLKSLEEVQSYIKENGHLPNIPSAKEMETNGIQIGEMNMKLLEKIEELTLYILEQQKEINNYKIIEEKLKVLFEQNKLLQNQINELKSKK